MKVIIGTDHRGIELKNNIIEYLKDKNIDVIQISNEKDKKDDYPDIAYAVAKEIAKKEFDKGILICGTGIGMSIAANKVRGIRCGVCNDRNLVKHAREDNDINILAIGSNILDIEDAKEIIDIFLQTEFLGERHLRRINKIADIENNELLGRDIYE